MVRDYTFPNCTSLTNVSFPDSLTEIQDSAFYGCSSLTHVTLPASVTNIGYEAFASCRNLTGVYCKGNPPSADPSAFASNSTATIFYLPGSSGWGATFAVRPTVMWSPQVQTSDASFGVRSNQFGFTITGTSNMLVVVEASGSLENPLWSPLQTITLASGSGYFSDPMWKYSSRRFYCLRLP